MNIPGLKDVKTESRDDEQLLHVNGRNSYSRHSTNSRKLESLHSEYIYRNMHANMTAALGDFLQQQQQPAAAIARLLLNSYAATMAYSHVADNKYCTATIWLWCAAQTHGYQCVLLLLAACMVGQIAADYCIAELSSVRNASATA